MTRSRRTFTAEEKAAVVKRYLIDKTPVSDLCDELGLQPTQIYAWQKLLFENAAAAASFIGKFARSTSSRSRMLVALWPIMYSITTKYGFTVPSATRAPHTKLAGEERAVFAARDRKLEAAREKRRQRRQQQAA